MPYRDVYRVCAPAPAPDQAAPHPNALTLAGFAVLVLLTGLNPVAVRILGKELPPFWAGGSRFAVAAAIMFIYVAVRRLPLPNGRDLIGPLIFGALQFGIAFAFGYWSLQVVPAGIASLALATVPIFTLVFAALARLEHFRSLSLIGALVSIAGVAVMFLRGGAGDIPLVRLFASVMLAVCLALAAVVVKRFPRVHAATMNAVGMSVGAVILLALSLIAGEKWALPTRLETWMAQLYLILPGSVGLFAVLIFVLRRWTATAVSYQSVLSPIVTIAVSAWLLSEHLTGRLAIGGLLVLIGVYVGTAVKGRRVKALPAAPR